MNHAQRYISLAEKRFDSLDFRDTGYQAAFYLLSYNPELYELASKHVDREGVHFAQIKKQAEQLDPVTDSIVGIAYSLFKGNSSYKISPYDIACLGYPYLELVTNALYVSADQAIVRFTENMQSPGVLQLTVDLSKWGQTKVIMARIESMTNHLPCGMQP